MNGTRVLLLLPLLAGLAHSFSWDIVVGAGKRLKFYNNGALAHIEDIPSAKKISAVIYDPVDFRVLFADRNDDSRITISSYEVTTGKLQTIAMRYTRFFSGNLAYDPVKQLLFWNKNKKIYSISLNPASSNTTDDGKVIVTLDDDFVQLAVDSCEGYIYMATRRRIERALFDGSEREDLVDTSVDIRESLAIDQLTQRMFWIDRYQSNNFKYFIESADLNGQNRRTLYSVEGNSGAADLTVSNDYIYWKSYNQRAILRLPKHQPGVAPTVYAGYSIIFFDYPIMAANYTIEEQTLGTKSCEALKSLSRRSTAKSSSEMELQVYGSTCLNYCLEGNCTISAEGLPNCSCEAGYTGKRCEVSVCYMYCLHGGICSLNEEDEPVCQCTAAYEGARCDVATSTSGVQAEYTKQEIRQDLRREVKQIILEELKHALLLFSDKIDEYEVNIEKDKKPIEDQNR